MIFEGKSVFEINDDEIDVLVSQHLAERQHLEFKAIINYKYHSDRLEILKDIASFANAGGGYILIGIRDDGKGRAQTYEKGLLKDTQAIKKAISGLCLDHISERIEGVEIDTRIVKNNPLVIIRIPKSARTPHMITYQNNTGFYVRYHDGKREMTIGEIKEAFHKDLIGHKLSMIEYHLQNIVTKDISEKERKDFIDKIKSGSLIQLSNIENGNLLSEVALKRFETEVGQTPYLWISATPVNPRANLIDVDSEEMRQLITFPPGSNPGGWNMESSSFPIQRFGEGITKGRKDYEYLELINNGHMEFWTPLNEHFCWRQSEEEFRHQPRLYPYPVTEYPTSFLRLYNKIIELNLIQDEFIICLNYRNINGYILRPYAPDMAGFSFLLETPPPFSKQHLVYNGIITHGYNPDIVAFNLLKYIYASFGYNEEAIPFYNREKGEFYFR